MNNCLHKCYMTHDEGIYIDTEYRNSDSVAMFCDELKVLIVGQLAYNYWLVGWNCVKLFADWLDRMTI